MRKPTWMGMRRLCLCLSLFAAAGCDHGKPTMQVEGGDAERGKALIGRYGCVACHAVPGIVHHGSNVGPPLDKMAKRAYVGGVLPNTPEDLVRWLRDPPAVDPRTAMPNLGISEAEARDIAAYLYTLK
jgi:cytochrome c